MITFDEKYWTNRYHTGQTQWDAGEITTPLKTYFDGVENRDRKILIPGGGNGHEAAYLHQQGFKKVYLLDFSETPLKNFHSRYPGFPQEHLLQEDFFKLEGSFDIIVEQTFFCALHPGQRPAYARKAAELLKPGGKLVGLLFNIPLNTENRNAGHRNAGNPPFGGERAEYLEYFTPYFTLYKMEPCYNSIKPRQGKELWMELEVRD